MVPPGGENPVRTWDAGAMGCGELIMKLRQVMNELAAGEILELVSKDPGAPEDLPSWCRLTGHRLVKAEHPIYWIERKGDKRDK